MWEQNALMCNTHYSSLRTKIKLGKNKHQLCASFFLLVLGDNVCNKIKTMNGRDGNNVKKQTLCEERIFNDVLKKYMSLILLNEESNQLGSNKNG